MRRYLALAAVAALLTFGAPAPAAACYGEPCDTISAACYTLEPLLHKLKLDPACALG